MGDKIRMDRIVFHDEGFREVLTSKGVAADIEKRLRAVQSAAGGAADYGMSLTGGSRIDGAVWTETRKAKIAEAVNRTLLRAFGAGG